MMIEGNDQWGVEGRPKNPDALKQELIKRNWDKPRQATPMDWAGTAGAAMGGSIAMPPGMTKPGAPGPLSGDVIPGMPRGGGWYPPSVPQEPFNMIPGGIGGVSGKMPIPGMGGALGALGALGGGISDKMPVGGEVSGSPQLMEIMEMLRNKRR